MRTSNGLLVECHLLTNTIFSAGSLTGPGSSTAKCGWKYNYTGAGTWRVKERVYREHISGARISICCEVSNILSSAPC